MSASIAQRLAQLSVESAEDRYEEALATAEASEEEGMESVSDMVEHAEKAEEVAEQLEELAEKAEEVADEDKAYLLNEVSTEAFSMVYANIMKTNNLQMAATSFESAQTHQEKMLGLAKDARGVVMQVRQYQDQVLDFSPEGKVLSFLRRDKVKLAKAFTELRSVKMNESQIQEALGEGTVATHKGAFTLFSRDGKIVTDLPSAVKNDVSILLETHKQVEATLSQLKSKVTSSPDAFELPAPDFKIINQPLLGNVHYGQTYLNRSNQSQINEKLRTAGGQIKWAGWTMLKGAALAGLASTVSASAIVPGAVYVGYVNLKASQDTLGKESVVISANGVGKAAEELLKLEVLTRRDDFDEKVKEINSKITDENRQVVKTILSILTKIHEETYEHAYRLTTGFSKVLSAINKNAK